MVAGTTISFLRADTNIDCRGEKHQSFLRIIIPLILIYQLIPVMYFVLLYRVRNKLNPQNVDDTTALRIVQSNRTDPDVIPLRFLFKGYSKKYWFWECLEAYRRMIFISGLPLFYSAVNRGITGSVVSWGCAMLYREVPPFKQTSTNLLNICTLQQITLTFFMATLIETGALSEYGGLNSYAIGSVLTCVNVAFIVVAMGFAYRFFRIKMKKEGELQKNMNAQLLEFEGTSTKGRSRSLSARGSAAGHDDGDGDDEELPAAMREFVPICHTPEIVEAMEGLQEIEKLFLEAHQNATVVGGMSKKGRARQGIEDETSKGSRSGFAIGHMNISLPSVGMGMDLANFSLFSTPGDSNNRRTPIEEDGVEAGASADTSSSTAGDEVKDTGAEEKSIVASLRYVRRRRVWCAHGAYLFEHSSCEARAARARARACAGACAGAWAWACAL